MCKGDLEMGLLSRACGLSQQNQNQQNQNSLPNKAEKKITGCSAVGWYMEYQYSKDL